MSAAAHLCFFSQVAAVAARKLEDAQEFAKKHSISRAYGSYEQLARDPDVGQCLSAVPFLKENPSLPVNILKLPI